MEKRIAQIKHFIKRSRQRVGYKLFTHKILKDIQSGRLKIYDKTSNRVTVYKYTHNKKNYKIVYDKYRKTLVTIMPLEWKEWGQEESFHYVKF